MEEELTREEVRDFINENTVFLDEFDDCVVGSVTRCGMNEVVAYSVDKILEKLMKGGMDADEAVEYFQFNIEGAYVGENTPMFLSNFTIKED